MALGGAFVAEKQMSSSAFIFYTKMNKKFYQQPSMKVVKIQSCQICVGSTGATGEDAPWASVKEQTMSLDDMEQTLKDIW